MRMRLGLLQDPEVIDRQVRREQEELEKKRNPAAAATAKTKEETEAENKEKEEIRKKLKGKRPRIKPLSESKAIDSGATFISEGFLFLVAGGLILWESWRRDSKEGRRRDEVQMRLEKLEDDIDSLRSENRTLKSDVHHRHTIDGAVGAPLTLGFAHNSTKEKSSNTTSGNLMSESEKTTESAGGKTQQDASQDVQVE